MTTAFRRAQIGKESTRGTAVAADVVMTDGVLTMDPDVDFSIPEEDRNSLAARHSRTRVRDEVTLQWTGPVTFQHVIHWLGMGVKGGVAASQPDAGNDPNTYLYSFIRRLNTSNAPDAYTMEFGDDQQEYECEFVMASQITFKWEMGSTVQVTVDMYGRNLTTSSFTDGALSALTTEEAVASKTKVWIDGTWADLGSTQKQNEIRAIEITIPTGVARYRTADGKEWYTTFVEQKTAATVRLTIASGADAETEYTAWRDGSLRGIRVQTLGSIIDTNYNYTLEFDLLVKWDENPEILRDDEGGLVYTFIGHTYDDHTDNSSNPGTGQSANGNSEGNDYAVEVLTNVSDA